MKRSFYLVLAIVALLACTGQFLTRAAHASAHDQRHAFTPDTIPWGPAPPFLAPGAQLAVLEGDPTATTGDFTVRLKMPDGYRIAPHFHPFRPMHNSPLRRHVGNRRPPNRQHGYLGKPKTFGFPTVKAGLSSSFLRLNASAVMGEPLA